MNILITGNFDLYDDVRNLIPDRHTMTWLNPSEIRTGIAKTYNLIMDLDLDNNPDRLGLYSELTNRPVIACSVRKSLANMVKSFGQAPGCTLMGMNLLPGFMQRPYAEVCTLHTRDSDTLENIFNALGLPFTQVSDRAGMVTPRIISMIINEAAYLLQEKGATQQGIDSALLLGVNYPMGPLTWADKIGIENVVKVLKAVHQETGDERYRVCPLLLRMSQLGEVFYP